MPIERAETAPRTVGVWLTATVVWYVTGLLAALSFSFGFYLVKPGNGLASNERAFIDALTWMDGRWYKQIAEDGYQYNRKFRSNAAFFPVYPLLGRAVMLATGLRAEAALLVVSNLSLLAALGMLALYARATSGEDVHDGVARIGQCPVSRTAAHRSVAHSGRYEYTILAAALFPTGCFFRFAYSESTFLLLAILAMYAMQRRWNTCLIALIVGLATGARPVGVALLAPFVIHTFCGRSRRVEAAATSVAARGRAVRRGRRFWWVMPMLHCALHLPLACWGLLAFMVFQHYVFGDAFALFKVQSHWRIRDAIPWEQKVLALATLEPIWSVFNSASPAYWATFDARLPAPWFSLQLANPLIFLGAVGVMAFGAWPRSLSPSTRKTLDLRADEPGQRALVRERWLSLEEISLGTLLLLIPYVARGYDMGMCSMGRFTAVVFPVYLVVGRLLSLLPNAFLVLIAVLGGLYLAAFTALYAGGYVVF